MRPRLQLLLIVLSVLFVPTALAAAGDEEIRVSKEPQTLVWQNREIFVFRAEVDDFGPKERVKSALQHLSALEIGATAPEVETRSLLGAISVQVTSQPIFTFVKEDLPPGLTLDEASAEVKAKLGDAFAAYVATHGRGFLLRAVTRSAIATIVFLVVFLLLLRISRLIIHRIPIADGADEVEFNLRPYATSFVRGIVRLVFLSMELFAIYAWATFVLGVFPYTRPWSDAAAGFLADTAANLALGALHSIPGLITVTVIFWLTRVFVRVLESFFRAVADRRIEVSWLQPETSGATRRLVVAIIWIFSITVAYPYIPGSGSAAFKGVSVFVGLMVSLGSAGLVNQVMSGLVVVYSRAFKPGEYIRVNDVEGAVSEIGVLSTKLITKKLEEVTIPNAVLVNTMTKNYSSVSADSGVILYTGVTIGYDTPWRQVHAMLLLAAERTAGVRREPKPFVFQTALSDFYAEYQLNAHIEDPQRRAPVLSELHANIQDVFNEFGVQIMSPNFVTQPDQAVLTPKERWFDAPAKVAEEGTALESRKNSETEDPPVHKDQPPNREKPAEDATRIDGDS